MLSRGMYKLSSEDDEHSVVDMKDMSLTAESPVKGLIRYYVCASLALLPCEHQQKSPRGGGSRSAPSSPGTPSHK